MNTRVGLENSAVSCNSLWSQSLFLNLIYLRNLLDERKKGILVISADLKISRRGKDSKNWSYFINIKYKFQIKKLSLFFLRSIRDKNRTKL